MEYKGRIYKEVLGSDLPNDGMYLELQDQSGKVIATVFRSDLDGKFEVHVDDKNAPTVLVDSFISEAKARLEKRANT